MDLNQTTLSAVDVAAAGPNRRYPPWQVELG
jgi:hypothetical protein